MMLHSYDVKIKLSQAFIPYDPQKNIWGFYITVKMIKTGGQWQHMLHHFIPCCMGILATFHFTSLLIKNPNSTVKGLIAQPIICLLTLFNIVQQDAAHAALAHRRYLIILNYSILIFYICHSDGSS